MKTIELSAAIASAPVQENLKNFAGLDAQNALGLMTPERLAAVAGEKLPVASAERNGLLSKRNSQSVISLSNNQVALIHTTLSMEWDATNMILYLCSDTPMSILSVVLRSGSTTNRCSINTVYRSEVLATVKFYKEVNSNHIVKLYIKNLSEYTLTIIKENLFNFNGNYTNIQKAAIDVAGMEEVNIIK